MITELDVKLAYRKETGKKWNDNIRRSDEFEYVLEKLLKHENDFAEVMSLFEDYGE